mgnify:CR=1 FL=1
MVYYTLVHLYMIAVHVPPRNPFHQYSPLKFHNDNSSNTDLVVTSNETYLTLGNHALVAEVYNIHSWFQAAVTNFLQASV